MKLWIKILFIVIIVLVLVFSAAYLFLVFKGKALITKQLEGLTHKKVSIVYLGLTPPFNLEIKNLDIEGLAKIDSISISPSILGFLSGSIALNEVKIIRPEFTYERFAPTLTESATTATSAPPVAVISPAIVEPSKRQPLRLISKHLNIKDGKINFIDRTVGENGIKINVKDINFNLTNLYTFPHTAITNFELKGRIPWQQGAEEGRIEAEGWLNLFKKDMQATLKIEGIDGIYLYPYYSNWVDLEKARIQKAKLNFASQIQGLNNDVTAQCHLELTDIVFRPRAPEEQQEKAEKIAAVVLDILKALNQGKIVLDFTIKTKMDKPEFGFGDIKMAFEDKLAQSRKTNGFKVDDALMLPGKLIQGTFKGATDITKAVIIGTINAGKEIGKTVEDTFKKEPKEKKE